MRKGNVVLLENKDKVFLLILPSGISVSYGNDAAASKSVTGSSEASLVIKIAFKL